MKKITNTFTLKDGSILCFPQDDGTLKVVTDEAGQPLLWVGGNIQAGVDEEGSLCNAETEKKLRHAPGQFVGGMDISIGFNAKKMKYIRVFLLILLFAFYGLSIIFMAAYESNYDWTTISWHVILEQFGWLCGSIMFAFWRDVSKKSEDWQTISRLFLALAIVCFVEFASLPFATFWSRFF